MLPCTLLCGGLAMAIAVMSLQHAHTWSNTPRTHTSHLGVDRYTVSGSVKAS